MDNKQGIANKQGIPWDLSIDRQYFRNKTKGSSVLMGFNTYQEFGEPLPDRKNLVVCRADTELREGFEPVFNTEKLLKTATDDIWIIGGAKLFEQTLLYADELYLTQIDQNFRCSKYFPDFQKLFRRKSQSPDHHQNGTTFRFEVWERLKLNHPKARKV